MSPESYKQGTVSGGPGGWALEHRMARDIRKDRGLRVRTKEKPHIKLQASMTSLSGRSNYRTKCFDDPN